MESKPGSRINVMGMAQGLRGGKLAAEHGARRGEIYLEAVAP